MASPHINDLFDLGFYASMYNQGFTVKQAHTLYKYACAFDTYAQMEKTAAYVFFPSDPEKDMQKSAEVYPTWGDLQLEGTMLLEKVAGYYDKVDFGALNDNLYNLAAGTGRAVWDGLTYPGRQVVNAAKTVGNAVADDYNRRTAGAPGFKPIAYGASYARDLYDTGKAGFGRSVGNAIGGTAKKLWGGITGGLGALWNGAKRTAGEVANAASAGWNHNNNSSLAKQGAFMQKSASALQQLIARYSQPQYESPLMKIAKYGVLR